MLAFLGGTGPEGRGLALRLAAAGEQVVIGSRVAERAASVAGELATLGGLPSGDSISGVENSAAAAQAEVVFLPVPYEAQRPLLEHLGRLLSGKVVVNVISPMKFERGKGASAVAALAGSAAQEAQQLVPQAQVVAAFQTVSAEDLQQPDKLMQGDVIVCSDHPEAKKLVMGLVEKIPDLRPIDGGALANSKYVEQMTPLLVNINRIYKIHAGIKIVGL